jgi:hypothetical protein
MRHLATLGFYVVLGLAVALHIARKPRTRGNFGIAAENRDMRDGCGQGKSPLPLMRTK